MLVGQKRQIKSINNGKNVCCSLIQVLHLHLKLVKLENSCLKIDVCLFVVLQQQDLSMTTLWRVDKGMQPVAPTGAASGVNMDATSMCPSPSPAHTVSCSNWVGLVGFVGPMFVPSCVCFHMLEPGSIFTLYSKFIMYFSQQVKVYNIYNAQGKLFLI